MYRFVDRPLTQLDDDMAFLVEAMRTWVGASMAGRCACAALRGPFARHGMPEALPDFGMAMAALNIDGLARLSFAPPGYVLVNDDEARLLALFSASRAPDPGPLRRHAAGLVAEDAVLCLMLAVERVGAAFPIATPTTRGNTPPRNAPRGNAPRRNDS
ncbi:MAG: hypothetical protein V4564_25800 [Pseudomonadota bacterium]|uniref:hypothetical protein n=1 Tax=Sphingomonas sp. ERG5 TaxID=1381597 RepID=UPI00068AEB7D|nr:hypothetical protein [Sphingomonas sp. ERG5]